MLKTRTILDRIIDHKLKELDHSKSQHPEAELRKLLAGLDQEQRDFKCSLSSGISRDKIKLVAEMKKASPSAGLLEPDYDPAKIAECYEHAGADAISVLTDQRYFRGDLEDLRSARAATTLPLLRKDFIIDSYQLYESRAFGADAVLLISAVLEVELLSELLGLSNELGMDCLVEIRSEADLGKALRAGSAIIGINARDLRTMEEDISIISRLAEKVPKHTILVAESAIKVKADVRTVQQAGADAILVGTALMRSHDPAETISSLLDVAYD